LLRLEQVFFGYREAGARREVLRGVDLDVRAGEQLALLGQSGSGKSTLLHLACGLDRPDAGRVQVDGVDLAALGEPARSLWRRRQVGFVYQFFNLIPTLTVLENVLLPLELNGVPARQARASALARLADVDLAGRADSWPDRLSGGEQQRVAIARALAHAPTLVLADEPTGNLDQANGGQVMDLLDRLVRGQGRTLLVATHSAELARRADRTVRLVDGRLDVAA
jgi:putative ABC transport system ATP-binding protein